MIEIKSNRDTVITVCGSMKYWDDIIETASRLTKMGYIVLSPYRINMDVTDNEEEIRIKLKDSFERKIDMSDILFVVNKDGYIGESVYSEIQFAIKHNKRVEFLEVGDIAPIFTICGSKKFEEQILQYTDNLRKAGKIVFTPESFNIKNPDKLTKEEWQRWHNIHYQKMQMSDYIIIYDEGGYIGDDTRREIDYALLRGMRVIYFSKMQKFEDINNLRQEVLI